MKDNKENLKLIAIAKADLEAAFKNMREIEDLVCEMTGKPAAVYYLLEGLKMNYLEVERLETEIGELKKLV